MGNYSVPESIRKHKPTGTMVKRISNNYYVYEYSTVKGEDGKRHTKMGKIIGSIKEGIGFVPNDSFACDSEISTRLLIVLLLTIIFSFFNIILEHTELISVEVVIILFTKRFVF